MVGESDKSSIYWTPSSEQPKPKMNWWRYLVIVTNIVFAAVYVIVTIWQSTIFWFYAILFPFYFLLFWLSYRTKSDEYSKSLGRGKPPNLSMTHDIISLVVSVFILVVIVVAMSFDASAVEVLFFTLPLYMIALMNFENLGSFLAYFRITRNDEAKNAFELGDSHT